MNVAFAECTDVVIYFNIPKYYLVQSSASASKGLLHQVSFKHQKLCSVGQWTETAGSTIKDTKCTACSTGRFRVKPATDGKAEIQANVCKDYKLCSAGQWTETAGDDSKEPT